MRFDSLILNAYVNREIVGIYSVAVATSESSWVPSSGVDWVPFPMTAATEDRAAEAVRVALASRLSVFLTALVSAALLLLSVVALPLGFGRACSDARNLLAIVVVGGVSFSLSMVYSGAFAGGGKPEYSRVVAGAGFSIMIFLDLVLIPLYGVRRAAVAASSSYWASGVLAATIYARHIDLTFSEYILVKRGDLRVLAQSLRLPRGHQASALATPSVTPR